MPEVIAIKYRAFLSYSHKDSNWAKWLHKRLEGFKLGAELVGQETTIGPVPETLRPIFRDRDEFTGGHTLTDATIAALDASAALIVLCSLNAAASHYVNEEVRLFRSRHPDRPVVPVLIDGTAETAFPPALRFAVGINTGAVTETPVTILSPDLRDAADGKSLGLAKTVAGITGLTTDTVFNRVRRQERRSARIRNGVIGSLALLLVASVGAGTYAWHLLRTNEAAAISFLKTAPDLVDYAVTGAEKIGVQRTYTLGLLQRAERLFDDISELGRQTPEMQRQKAWMLIQFARNYEVLGRTAKQAEYLDQAERIMRSLAGRAETDLRAQRDLSVAFNERGDVLRAQGDGAGALKAYRASLTIRKRLAAADPNNAGWQRDLSVSHFKLGQFHLRNGHPGSALPHFEADFRIAERLARRDPSNAHWQKDLQTSQRIMKRVKAALASAGRQ